MYYKYTIRRIGDSELGADFIWNLKWFPHILHVLLHEVWSTRCMTTAGTMSTSFMPGSCTGSLIPWPKNESNASSYRHTVYRVSVYRIWGFQLAGSFWPFLHCDASPKLARDLLCRTAPFGVGRWINDNPWSSNTYQYFPFTSIGWNS